MIDLYEINRRISETFTTQEARENWLMRPNPFLNMEKPIALIARGDIQRVLDALEALDSGIFI